MKTNTMMQTVAAICTRLLEASSAAILFVLTMMTFVNVILRKCFNSGITVTEELGRYFLVWLLFTGAILAAGNRAHVKVDMFVSNLPRLPRVWVEIVCDGIMLYCCWLITSGGWALTLLNTENYMSVSGIPESTLYFSSVLSGIGMGAILAVRLIARLTMIGREDAATSAQRGTAWD
jgi:TRAP-type C4-dicarboxylate transport system permease small subunit